MRETVGIGVPNPRSVMRIPIPKNLSPEQYKQIENWIKKQNVKDDPSEVG